MNEILKQRGYDVGESVTLTLQSASANIAYKQGSNGTIHVYTNAAAATTAWQSTPVWCSPTKQ